MTWRGDWRFVEFGGVKKEGKAENSIDLWSTFTSFLLFLLIVVFILVIECFYCRTKSERERVIKWTGSRCLKGGPVMKMVESLTRESLIRVLYKRWVSFTLCRDGG